MPILHISMIFQNVISDDETFFFIYFILEILFNSEKRDCYFSIWNRRLLANFTASLKTHN